jgi:hypothetical protein
VVQMTMKIFEPGDPAELIKGWKLHAVKARRKHEEAARQLDRKRYLIGVPAIIVSAIVGASVIASLEAHFGAWVTIAVGLGSIAASILASLQTFLGYAERADKHRAAGVDYKAVIRELEEEKVLSLAALPSECAELRRWLDDIRSRFDDLEQKTPIVPHKIDRAIESENFLFAKSAEGLRR